MLHWFLPHDLHVRMFPAYVKYWNKNSRLSAPELLQAPKKVFHLFAYKPGIFMHCLHSTCVCAIAIWRKFHGPLLWWFCAFPQAEWHKIHAHMRVSRAFVVFGIASHLACVRSSVKNRHVSLDAWSRCGCRDGEQIICLIQGRPIY